VYIRFGYRWRYENNEYSSLSPFSSTWLSPVSHVTSTWLKPFIIELNTPSE
jgi:hypothetical protein